MANTYTGVIQKGSKGNDVTQWQNYLKSQGYNVGNVDGIFGLQTEIATMAYKAINGLTFDGIVDAGTWEKAGFSPTNTMGPVLSTNADTTETSPPILRFPGHNRDIIPWASNASPVVFNATPPNTSSSGYTPTQAPILAPTPTAPQYDNSTYGDSAKGKANLDAYNAAKEALNKYGSFTFSENEWLKDVKDRINNYGDFSYDVNSDALYQQLAEQYMRNGKIAMQDAMGQAAAMTGGYGNSYADTVGNQTYLSYMQELNDKIPELYQLALDRYTMGKQDLYDKYGLLLSEYEREYGLYSDEYNKLLDALGIAKDDYYNGADMFYTEQYNKNDVLGKEFSDAMALWEADTTNKWEKAKWEEGLNQYANDETWRQKEYDLKDRQVSPQEKAYEYSENESANYGVSDSYTVNTPEGDGITQETYTYDASPSNSYNANDSTGIPEDIRTKAATFTDNVALDDYLTRQYNAGKITEEQMGELYLEYEIPALNKRNWTLENDGGVNWFWGLDGDIEVKDQYDNIYDLDGLIEALVADGMSEEDAEEYALSLQKKFGVG